MTPVKTVERAIDMLECFSAERPDLSVGQLASLLSVDKSVASRMAATLRSRRFLQMDTLTKRYRVGERLFELGKLFDLRESISHVATPLLRALVSDVGHASHVGVLDNGEVLIISCVESERQLQVAVQVGERRAVHATASGKLFLAYGSSELLNELCPSGKFKKIGPKTIATVSQMHKELATIRRAGIARNDEESARGVGAVAAPIYWPDKRIAASLTTIFPLSLVDAGELVRIRKHVRMTADSISLRLANA